MIEVAVVFDKQGRAIYWHAPPGRTGGSIPDSSKLWDVLWANRHELGGVAHVHPWNGYTRPSGTDITTFKAIEAGLGKTLLWPIVTMTEVVYCTQSPMDKNQYVDLYPDQITFHFTDWWQTNISNLRHLSK
jgi:hypothetical protein